jgi:hypothetical protein
MSQSEGPLVLVLTSTPAVSFAQIAVVAELLVAVEHRPLQLLFKPRNRAD